ncbi:kinase-like domain-containing protein [Gloeopeniophorella convolvens]|nr:kinase-like domain-containing protein [Gloeopeniophorella convolvens]
MLNAKLQSLVQFKAQSSGLLPAVLSPPQTSPVSTITISSHAGHRRKRVVYLAREKRTSALYALKAVDKIRSNGKEVPYEVVANERTVLVELNGNDFVLPLHACFHDTENYYFVTEYLPGGDLQQLQEVKDLNVEAVRFYMAELLLAIEHVHAHNIIHRDLKPENVLIDSDGHVVLGDFGIARRFTDVDVSPTLSGPSSPNMYSTHGRVGTPAFSPPEVLFGKEYSFEVDFWAYGVILYELLSGRDAFQANTVPLDDPTWLRHYARHVKWDELVVVESECMTVDAIDLLNKLMRKSPTARLSNASDIKKHPFFAGIDWSAAASRSLTPPWIPLLVSTRLAGVHFIPPDVSAGERYTATADPCTDFSFRASASAVSAASVRRQNAFRHLEGTAPLISWAEGSSCPVAEPCRLTRRASERQVNLKAFSKWVKRALSRPVRSA